MACPVISPVYNEQIKTFTFNGIDGITIPKSCREKAYELSVDVIIKSVARESYQNYECMPAESYYGAATLVMQDCLELKIPVKFPRQRLYYGRVPEAFVAWQELINFEYHVAWHYFVANTVVNLGTALGAIPLPPTDCCALPQPVWRELPLREVYFHPPIGTQYELEVSWIEPSGFVGFCGTAYSGYSQQEDGEKDAGLPPNGIFPHVAENPADPYANLPPVTPDSVQGAFSNSKVANIDDVDPANIPVIPDPPGTVYWVKVVGVAHRPSFPGGCSTTITETYYYARTKSQTVQNVRAGAPIPTGCGDATTNAYYLTLTGAAEFDLGQCDGGAHQITLQQGLSQPSNTTTYS